jgi:hypothetical protein
MALLRVVLDGIQQRLADPVERGPADALERSQRSDARRIVTISRLYGAAAVFFIIQLRQFSQEGDNPAPC